MKKQFTAIIGEIELRESEKQTDIWVRVNWKFEKGSSHYKWIKL